MFTRGKYKVIYLLKTGNYIASNQLRPHWKLPWPTRSKHSTINGKRSRTADNEGVSEGQTLQDEDMWVVEWEKILWEHWQLKWGNKESKKRGGSGDDMGPRPTTPTQLSVLPSGHWHMGSGPSQQTLQEAGTVPAAVHTVQTAREHAAITGNMNMEAASLR